MIYLFAFISLFCVVFLILIKHSKNSTKYRLYSSLMRENELKNLKRINMSGNIRDIAGRFYEKKLVTVVYVLLIGSVMAMLYEISIIQDKTIENNCIEREEKGGKAYPLSLSITNLENKEKSRVSINVAEEKYEEAELNMLYTEAANILEHIIINENISKDSIISELNLTKKLEGYPFELSYRISEPLIINSKGCIVQEELKKRENYEKGIDVIVTAIFRYEEYVRELNYSLRVFPVVEEISFEEAIGRELTEIEKNTREDGFLYLPGTVAGIPVVYEKAHSASGMAIFLIAAICAVFLYKQEDTKLSDALKKRNEEAENDYKGLVNKFVLFYSVGLPTKKIFLQICSDYRKKQNRGEKSHFIYEEMLRSEQRMSEGLGEIEVYEEFGQRIRLPQYRRLTTIMCQAVMKGKQDVEGMLADELEKSFSERKNRAKKKAEEAGTKLLLPMFMMLFAVLLIIMIPAFISFKM